MSADTFLHLDVELADGDRGSIAVVRAAGEIDLASADRLESALATEAVTEATGITLDLRDVAFIDSSGLRVLLVAKRELSGGLALVVTEGSPVERLLEMSELRTHLPVYRDTESAVTALGGAGGT